MKTDNQSSTLSAREQFLSLARQELQKQLERPNTVYWKEPEIELSGPYPRSGKGGLLSGWGPVRDLLRIRLEVELTFRVPLKLLKTGAVLKPATCSDGSAWLELEGPCGGEGDGTDLIGTVLDGEDELSEFFFPQGTRAGLEEWMSLENVCGWGRLSWSYGYNPLETSARMCGEGPYVLCRAVVWAEGKQR